MENNATTIEMLFERAENYKQMVEWRSYMQWIKPLDAILLLFRLAVSLFLPFGFFLVNWSSLWIEN
jgi:hypothetical protein